MTPDGALATDWIGLQFGFLATFGGNESRVSGGLRLLESPPRQIRISKSGGRGIECLGRSRGSVTSSTASTTADSVACSSDLHRKIHGGDGWLADRVASRSCGQQEHGWQDACSQLISRTPKPPMIIFDPKVQWFRCPDSEWIGLKWSLHSE